MIIVSACLAGIKCRYDGQSNLIPEIKKMVVDGKAIALCPEELGGLPTPRIPCEMIKEGNHLLIKNREGEDLTDAFMEGAEKVAAIAKILDCKTAILKSRSPSCGYGIIYDGTFTGKLTIGDGCCAKLLAKQGVQILNEENFNPEDQQKKVITTKIE